MSIKYLEKGEKIVPKRSFIQTLERGCRPFILDDGVSVKEWQEYWNNINKEKSMGSIKVEKNVNELNEIMGRAKELIAEIKEINDYSAARQDKPKPKKMVKIRLKTIQQLIEDGAKWDSRGDLHHSKLLGRVCVGAKHLQYLGTTVECSIREGTSYCDKNSVKWYENEVAEVIYE